MGTADVALGVVPAAIVAISASSALSTVAVTGVDVAVPTMGIGLLAGSCVGVITELGGVCEHPKRGMQADRITISQDRKLYEIDRIACAPELLWMMMIGNATIDLRGCAAVPTDMRAGAQRAFWAAQPQEPCKGS